MKIKHSLISSSFPIPLQQSQKHIQSLVLLSEYLYNMSPRPTTHKNIILYLFMNHRVQRTKRIEFYLLRLIKYDVIHENKLLASKVRLNGCYFVKAVSAVQRIRTTISKLFFFYELDYIFYFITVPR